MPICNRDGVDLYYEVHGSGPAILLTHGFSATSKMWASQIDALGQSHTLILWDMRGHGQSGSPDDQALYSEAHTTADMCALLDHLDIKQAIVGGLSLGGVYVACLLRGLPGTGPEFVDHRYRARVQA